MNKKLIGSILLLHSAFYISKPMRLKKLTKLVNLPKVTKAPPFLFHLEALQTSLIKSRKKP